jgi:Protein of unknown function (DUF3152)
MRFTAVVSAVFFGLGLLGYAAGNRLNWPDALLAAPSSPAPPINQPTPTPVPSVLAAKAVGTDAVGRAESIEVPSRGTGRFQTAPGGSTRVGVGRLLRYLVVAEIGSGESPAEFAAAVDATLADPRSWIADRRWAFQRVSTGPSDFTVHLATPGTTVQMCDRFGLRTLGEVSCRAGRNVVINLKRWRLGVDWYAGALSEYRDMVVNHEVGHFLGHSHVRCPATGRLAPVMQQQSFGLQGCARNPWPYPDGKTYVTGPAAAH